MPGYGVIRTEFGGRLPETEALSWSVMPRNIVQGCTSMWDIGHRPIEFAKCPFDLSVERTNVPLLSRQHSHCLVIF